MAFNMKSLIFAIALIISVNAQNYEISSYSMDWYAARQVSIKTNFTKKYQNFQFESCESIANQEAKFL